MVCVSADELLNSLPAVWGVLVVTYASGRERAVERAAGKLAMAEPMGWVVSLLKNFTHRSAASVGTGVCLLAFAISFQFAFVGVVGRAFLLQLPRLGMWMQSNGTSKRERTRTKPARSDDLVDVIVVLVSVSLGVRCLCVHSSS